MFQFSKPDRDEVNGFLDSASRQSYSYAEVGATLGELPGRYLHHDHNRIVVGRGIEDWETAKRAIREWKMFDLVWCRICWPETPIEEGRNVAMMASHIGLWSLNAARIVYTLDEPDRFGFAYGTLADHAECGEERFSVEIDRESGDIHYDLYSFSRPRHLLARLGYPYARYLQKQFVVESMQAMLRAVAAEKPTSNHSA
ncbi:MAG: DUF1990 domain-containing protein [Pyrinomonadaceae bacterium]